MFKDEHLPKNDTRNPLRISPKAAKAKNEKVNI